MSFLKNLTISSTLLSLLFSPLSFIKSNLTNNIDAPDKPEISKVVTNISNPKSPYNTIDMKSTIMDKNLLYVTGFEDGDMPYSYKYSNFPSGHNREFGGQSKVDYDASEGIYSTKIIDTYSNGNYDNGYDLNGNHKGYANYSVLKYDNKLYLPDNIYVSTTLDFKSDEKVSFSPLGIGGTIDNPKPWGNRYFLKDANIGDTKIYVSGLTESIKESVLSGHKFYIVLNHTTTGGYSYANIKEVNLEENFIILTESLKDNFLAGEPVLEHCHINPVTFPSKEFSPSDKWKNIQLNALVDSSAYTASKRGITFWLRTTTHGTAYVDNIRFGYSNKFHLYRDGNKIYEGYDTSYKDNSVKDLTPPKKIENIQSDIIIKDNNTNTVRINIPSVDDIGTEYSYTLKASYDDIESEESETYISVITSGFDGFSYVIDSNPLTIPDNTIDTRSNYIEKDVSNNEDIYYLHIKSIDKSGNVSETSHIELQAFKTTIDEPRISEDGVNLNWDLNSNLNIDDIYFKVLKRNIENSDFNEIATDIKELKYIDNNSIDLNPPDMPSISNIEYNNDTNNIEYTISKILDNPSTYEYFVEMFNESDNSKISKSNIQSVDILSGIKGIYYIINNNPNSEIANGIELIDNNIQIPLTSEETYLHMKAVDNSNNESETLHLKISDNENPDLDLRLSEYLPTKNNITIVATGNDNIAVDYIVLPNGEKKYTNTLTYEVANNGEFEFTIFDKAGNSYTKSIEVNNIDKEVDNVTITKASTLFTKDKVTIKVRANDVSGINYIILPDGSKIFENSVDYDVFEDGVYNFTIRDNAGNEKVYSVTVDNIDKVFPTITISNNDIWTNNPIQININARD